MRVAALVLGLVGGILGLFGAGCALAIGGVGAALAVEKASTVIGGGWAAVGFSALGIVGGGLAMTKPRAAAALMLIAGIGGFISIFMAYLISAVLLLLGALFAFLGRAPRAQPQAAS